MLARMWASPDDGLREQDLAILRGKDTRLLGAAKGR